MGDAPSFATMARDGWQLVSGEARHARYPETFPIPDRRARESLSPGHAVQLLFDLQTMEANRVVDRGVDRMWVIVRKRMGDVYVGVLDNDPGEADGLLLGPGTEVVFGAEHVIAIERPPEGYVIGKYGTDFFED